MNTRTERLLILSVLAFIPSDGRGSESIPAECRALLNDLGAALRVFDQCALDNSRPFVVCRECASIYNSTRTLFSDVIEVSILAILWMY